VDGLDHGPAHWPRLADITRKDTAVDGVRIIKDTCSFDDLWQDDTHLPLLAAARVALGHTRWATQGKAGDLANASPLLTGSLVGTHNGDIDIASINVAEARTGSVYGSTDTERLYKAIDAGRKDRRKVVKTLTDVEGRAALAWIDRERQDRVYLSRAALSPLAIAWDAQGNLYWASNPDWFRAIDAMFDQAIGFHDITMVREGVLLTVSITGAEPTIEDLRDFKPQCRHRDAQMSDMVVWRGFDRSDITADKKQANHKVAKMRAVSSRKGTATWSDSWKSATSWGPASLPRYNDDLAGVSRQGTGQRSLFESALAAEEPDTEEFAGELAHLSAQAEDEAQSALLTWADEGCSTVVVDELRKTLTFQEEVDLARRWGLSGPTALAEFRKQVLAWESARTSSN